MAAVRNRGEPWPSALDTRASAARPYTGALCQPALESEPTAEAGPAADR